jgi:hypothetical protein
MRIIVLSVTEVGFGIIGQNINSYVMIVIIFQQCYQNNIVVNAVMFIRVLHGLILLIALIAEKVMWIKKNNICFYRSFDKN